MKRLAWLAAVSCLLLAACGQQSAPAPEGAAPAASPATTQAAPPAPAGAPAPGTAPAPAEVVNAGEELETVDSEEAAPASASPLLTAALAATPAAAAPPGKWTENQNYLRLIPAQATVQNLKAGHVEVVEVFWYACPHCFAIDPMIESWIKSKKPAYVDFVRVPAMWNDGTKLLGRMYYTVEALGRLENMHSAIFNAAHNNQLTLIDQGGDPEATGKLQAAFAQKFGVSAADYLREYNGFGVDQKMRLAEQRGRAYLVTSVPTFVVNGKYVTDVGHAGGEAQLFELLNDLAAMEKAGR
jgi:thiol:disulfide interchange protein DsbA